MTKKKKENAKTEVKAKATQAVPEKETAKQKTDKVKEEAPKQTATVVNGDNKKVESVKEQIPKNGEEVKQPRPPQMVTVNGEKLTHAHAYQSNKNPDDWFFTAKLDGNQLRPQLMKPEDAAAYQKREVTPQQLMETYYPTKLQKKVTPEEYKADNKLSDGRTIDKMVVYKEHDEQRPDYGKYRLYTQVGEQKMSRTMSQQDLNAYFDRVTTPSKLVEKNFGEQLHLASFYNQFKLPENIDVSVRLAKSPKGEWTVQADLGDKGLTSKAVLSWNDKQALFSSKTATKEQLTARYLNNEIKEIANSEKVSANKGYKM